MISEKDLVIPTLQYLNSVDNWVTTSDLIIHLEDVLKPSGVDLQKLANRQDTRFSQKVRNLVCHRTDPTSFIFNRLALYNDYIHSLKITQKGKNFIKSR